MKTKSKLTRPQIWIIAGVVSLVIAAGIFFGLLRPLNEQMEAANQKYTTNEPVAAQRPRAVADVAKANQEVAQAKQKFSLYERKFFTRSPTSGRPLVNVTNRFNALQDRWDLQGSQPYSLGPQVTRFLRQDKTVRITQAGLTMPAPPQDPNQAVAEELITLPLGNVTVEGTFNNVLNHTERWNRFNRLVLVDGLTLTGNSPRLVGSYALTCFVYTSGTPGQEIPSAGGGAAGGGGGFGGYGGGGYGGGGYGGGGGGYGGMAGR